MMSVRLKKRASKEQGYNVTGSIEEAVERSVGVLDAARKGKVLTIRRTSMRP